MKEAILILLFVRVPPSLSFIDLRFGDGRGQIAGDRDRSRRVDASDGRAAARGQGAAGQPDDPGDQLEVVPRDMCRWHLRPGA